VSTANISTSANTLPSAWKLIVALISGGDIRTCRYQTFNSTPYEQNIQTAPNQSCLFHLCLSHFTNPANDSHASGHLTNNGKIMAREDTSPSGRVMSQVLKTKPRTPPAPDQGPASGSG
jgi:hypothetical protein